MDLELHVGRARVAGGLTVFPVWTPSASERGYTTDLGEAEIAEREDGPAVPFLQVTNRGKQPVLLLEGHLFEGGWQNRMITGSVLLAAGQAGDVPVACVEAGRWGGSGLQASRGRRATPYVRAATAPRPGRAHGQQEVWRRVSQYDGAAASPTSSLTQHLDQREDDVRALAGDIRPLPGQTGVIIGIAGQPMVVEVFDDPVTLREQFDSIIAAAGLDAMGVPPVSTPSRRARRMAARIERAQLTAAGAEGDVARFTCATDDLDLTALTLRGDVVHLRALNAQHPMLAGV